jgi:hypothetical protein
VTAPVVQEKGVRQRCTLNLCLFSIFMNGIINCGARDGAVSLGTEVQAGTLRVRFPMVSLEFFIDIIVSFALWPWVQLSL